MAYDDETDLSAHMPDGDARPSEGDKELESEESWGIPKPLDMVAPVTPFRWDLLPPSFADYVRDVAERQGSVPIFTAVSLIAAFSAVVGNGIRIAPKSMDSWTIVPTVWAMLIGEASMMKTPTMTAGLMPLTLLQSQLDRDYDVQRERHIVDLELARLVNAELGAQAKLAMREGNLQEAHRILSMRPQIMPLHQPRLQVGDISEAQLVQVLASNPFGILAFHDELPTFFSRMLNRSGASERAMMLKAAVGDLHHSYERFGRPRIEIAEMTVSVLGGIQPGRLKSIVADAHGRGADGLLARFQLAVWPDAGPEGARVDRRPDEGAVSSVCDAFREGFEFSRAGSGPTILRFEDSAQNLFDIWSKQTLGAAAGAPSALQSHMVKSVKAVASLALLFEVMSGGRVAVSRGSTEMALLWAELLSSHAKRLYRLDNSGGSVAVRILNKRKSLPEVFTARDIYRANWGGLDNLAVEEGLVELMAAGYLRGAVRSTGGRPSTLYRWNPRIPL